MQLRTLSILVPTLYLVYGDASSVSPCGGKPADVFFILDSSGSITANDFRKELQFTKEVTSMFDVESGLVRVGVLSFSKIVTPQFGLGEYTNRDDMNNKIDDVSYEGMGTNTAEALSYLHVKGMNDDKVRPDIPHIAIVLTDGMSQNTRATLQQAREVHDAGITVFVIGIGGQVDKTELEAIGSKPSDIYVEEIDGFDVLAHIQEKLAIKACKVLPASPPPDVQNTEAEIEEELLSHGSCTPRKPLNLVFAVDTAAIGASNTKFVLQFVTNISDHINMASSGSSISMLGNGCSGSTFDEEPSTDARGVKQAFSAYEAPKFDALLRNMRLKAVDGRMLSKHVGIVFVSDRLSSYEYRKSQLEMRRATFQKVVVFVFGIGERVDDSQAKSFATNGGDYFRVFNFERLNEAGTKFLYQLCLVSDDKM